MSFIDLMASDIWSDSDITRRTESMIHAEFPLLEENILNRKITAAQLGQWVLTEKEEADIERYKTICQLAYLEGVAARNDMALLHQILVAEVAKRRLDVPAIEPVIEDDAVINQAEMDQDLQERSEAQAVVDAASPEVMAWVDKRNPPVEEPTEPELSGEPDEPND